MKKAAWVDEGRGNREEEGKEGEQLWAAAVANFDVLTVSHCCRETVLMKMIMNGDDTDDGEVHTVFKVWSVEPQGVKLGQPSTPTPSASLSCAVQQLCSWSLWRGVSGKKRNPFARSNSVIMSPKLRLNGMGKKKSSVSVSEDNRGGEGMEGRCDKDGEGLMKSGKHKEYVKK